MDIGQFQLSLLHELSSLEFVQSIDIRTEALILRGRVALEKDRLLKVYFNGYTGTTAFAVVEGNRRVWGVDFDRARGWHMHPVGDPKSHLKTEPKSTKEIIDSLRQVWRRL